MTSETPGPAATEPDTDELSPDDEPTPSSGPPRQKLAADWLEPLLLNDRMKQARRAPLRRGSEGWTALRGADEMARAARFLLDLPGRERAGFVLLARAAHHGMTALSAAAGDTVFPASPQALWKRLSELPTGATVIAALPPRTRDLVQQLWEEGNPEDGWNVAHRRDRRERRRALALFVRRLLATAHREADTPAAVTAQRILRWALLVLLSLVISRGGSLLLRHSRRAPNLALYKPVEASSHYSARRFPKEGLTDGLKDRIGCHTREQSSPWVSIDLMQLYQIRRIVVTNRPGEFRDRAIPLIVEVSSDDREYREIARHTEPFSTWTLRFEPQWARHVRLTVDKTSTLHLEEVEIY